MKLSVLFVVYTRKKKKDSEREGA